MKNHYCVGYEGKDFALATWSNKQSKGLTNIATFFSGSSAEEKRQVLWQQVETRTLDKRISRFCDRARDNDLYLWYLSSHDLPTAQLIQRFLAWYHNQ
ncbi:hypothetical protein [Microcoleus sp. herbarium14]|uniref:hypothetical protein n=1 Tax=Microcoleus sp. herbarium14 TaxID=3055439 RepID=UPI002FD62201